MGTTVDFRPNNIIAWVDAFNLVEHARQIYPDLDKIIISPTQERVLVNDPQAIEAREIFAPKLNPETNKITWQVGNIDGYDVIVE